MPHNTNVQDEVAPASADLKRKNLAKNPTVGGNPPNESRKSENAAAT
jgi:hypothetical protein